MIKPDWNVFRAKFSEDLQQNFEWMCYLLFCSEFDKQTGIFRYKNQSAIETDPITVNGKLVGWQAKHYETTLSSNKGELLKMLEKAKRDYPDIETIYLYTNSEWGQSKGKEPAGKIEIDSMAAKLSIDLQWRCGSFFESPFVVNDHIHIASHFFELSDGIVESLLALELHTEKILSEIDTEILFSDRHVAIDRSDILSEFKTDPKQTVILSGDGGTGKTAVVKSLYQDRSPDSAFYVHKAAEFSVDRMEELLFGITLGDFIDAHKGVHVKIVVIDSAENLLSLKDFHTFRDYLSALLKNGWKILFTTRSNYLDDLIFQFTEFYRASHKAIHLSCLALSDLEALSRKFNFDIPSDQRLRKLITVPFYLREYLQNYHENRGLDYAQFRSSLWKKVIAKGSSTREQTLISMAVLRSNSGKFFIPMGADNANNSAGDALTKDGIICYESPHGYFITHDIYEEWALEKYIESKHMLATSNPSFFSEIGQSLPMRRAFRKWISEKLGDEDRDTILFIDNTIDSNEIPDLWKDEIIKSILIADHSSFFFDSYRDRLLENEFFLLKKICLLLRLSCKEVDNSMLEKVEILNPDVSSIEYVWTKPKGSGWGALISFAHHNTMSIRAENMGFILPIIDDWTSNHSEGLTTKYASLIALDHYKWMVDEDITIGDDAAGRRLVLTILRGVREIASQVEELVDLIVANEWKKHNDPFNLIGWYIIARPECSAVATILPEKVIALAKLFWTLDPSEEGQNYGSMHFDVGEEFGIKSDSRYYSPSSGYQTPIYQLLKTDARLALNFVIDFTNTATERYAESSAGANEVEITNVIVNDELCLQHLVSNRLWCMYRGSQVNSDILESILMSLERFLLDLGKNCSVKELETVLIHILRHATSGALTSVVASIVNAYPEKSFQAAKIIFRTRQFFEYDMGRFMMDKTLKMQLGMFNFGLGNDPLYQLHQNERIEACDSEHRKRSLEHTMLNYQFFRLESTSEKTAAERLDTLYDILDEHYTALPDRESETHEDKTWRLYLARMDKREMSPETIETEDGMMIEFNPKIDDELRRFSEDSLKESIQQTTYTPLTLWAESTLRNREDGKKYQQYESNPLSALHEAKEFWAEITSGSVPASSLSRPSTVSFVVAVLLRDFLDVMDETDLRFCSEIVLIFGGTFLERGYRYSVSDGVLPALSVLPIVLKQFPEHRGDAKCLMALAMSHRDHINAAGTPFYSEVVGVLPKLWREDFDCALSIYFGYMAIAQKQSEVFAENQRAAFEEDQFGSELDRHHYAFMESSNDILEKIIDDSIRDSVVLDVHNADVNIVSTAFQMVPLKTDSNREVPYANDMIEVLSKEILSGDSRQKFQYAARQQFLEKYTLYVLHLNLDEIEPVLKPFLDGFLTGENIAELLREFISTQDRYSRSVQFWTVWKIFKPKVIEMSLSDMWRACSADIVESFLFARNPWREKAREWRTFTPQDRLFFAELGSGLGGDPSYIYSIAKLISGIGSIYLEDGVLWLASALDKNDVALSRGLRDETIYCLEKSIRMYMFSYRERIKKNTSIRLAVLVILDYLVLNGSAVGYLLREDAL